MKISLNFSTYLCLSSIFLLFSTHSFAYQQHQLNLELPGTEQVREIKLQSIDTKDVTGEALILDSNRKIKPLAQQKSPHSTRLHSILEFDSEDDFSAFNNGFSYNYKNPNNKWSGNLVAAVNLRDKEFQEKKLSSIIHQLSLRYHHSTLAFIDIGKIKVGSNHGGSFDDLEGVIGLKLSLRPKKIALIQSWLDKNKIKIRGISLARYSYDSEDQIELDQLADSDTTKLSLFATKGKNSSFFYTFKKREGNRGFHTNTLGAMYNMKVTNGSLRFFAMAVHSKATPGSYPYETNLYIGKATYDRTNSPIDFGAKLIYDTYQDAHTDYKTQSIELFTETSLKDTPRYKSKLQVGVKFEEESYGADTEEEISYYIRLLTLLNL